jgi:hypothetical protein
MKRFFTILILSIIVLCNAAVTAAVASIAITADKNQATLEDVISLTISVEGARGEPVLPAMPAFEATRQGSSSRVQIINGQMSSSVDYSYLLYPKQEGAFTIGPATLDYKGSKFTSNTINITIGKAAARPAEASDKEVFVTAAVDNKNPYVNQQIVYTLKFYRRVRVANARLTESPSFEGFITEQLEKEKEYQTVVSGRQFMVTEIKQALFPAQAGTLTITPSTLQCDVVVRRQRRGGGFNDPFFDDSFFGFSQTEPKILRTSPIEVTVKPLPEEGKPRDYANLVGEFRAAAEISKKKLEVGESATLTLTLTGTGNLKSSQDMKIENLEGFKVYDDKPSFEQQVTGGQVGGTLVIKKALVPLKEGTLQIPAIALSYFNPQSGKYETARTEPQALEVLPAQEKEKLQVAEAEKSGTAKQEIKIIGKDILPIHTSVDVLSPVTLNPFTWVTALLFLSPILGFGIGFVLKHQKEKIAADTGLIRSKAAYKNLNRKLSLVKKSITHDDVSFYRDAGKAVKEFIGNKLNLSGGALTPEEIEQRLTDVRVAHATIEEFKNIIEMLEAAQFAFKNYPREEREAMLSSLQKVAKEIDKKMR